MHELSLLSDLLRKITSVAQEQNAEKVVSIQVKLGALCHLSADHFREHFSHTVCGTVAEGARLDIEVSTDQADPHAQEIVLESGDNRGALRGNDERANFPSSLLTKLKAGALPTQAPNNFDFIGSNPFCVCPGSPPI